MGYFKIKIQDALPYRQLSFLLLSQIIPHGVMQAHKGIHKTINLPHLASILTRLLQHKQLLIAFVQTLQQFFPIALPVQDRSAACTTGCGSLLPVVIRDEFYITVYVNIAYANNVCTGTSHIRSTNFVIITSVIFICSAFTNDTRVFNCIAYIFCHFLCHIHCQRQCHLP